MIGPVIEDVMMTRPRPLRASSETDAVTASIVPLTFVAKIASMSCSVISTSPYVWGDAGVGAQHIETPEPPDRVRNHSLDVGGHADVRANKGDLPARRPEVRDRGGTEPRVAAGDGDACSRLEERSGDALADAPGASSHEYGSASHWRKHGAASPS